MADKKLLYTCLKADPALVSQGFTTVVALESDRNPLAAFKVPADASAWCDQKNGLKPAPPPAPKAGAAMTQSATVTKTPASTTEESKKP